MEWIELEHEFKDSDIVRIGTNVMKIGCNKDEHNVWIEINHNVDEIYMSRADVLELCRMMSIETVGEGAG